MTARNLALFPDVGIVHERLLVYVDVMSIASLCKVEDRDTLAYVDMMSIASF